MTRRAAPAIRAPELPEIYVALGAEIGKEKANAFFVRFGGTSLYVPRRPHERSVIWRDCGREVARVLARLYGGENIIVPKMQGLRRMARWRAIMAATADHKSANQIARAQDLHVISVHRIRGKMRKLGEVKGSLL